MTFDVLIDTDLGGDPDDIQSLFRLLHYSDILKIKGIVSTPNTDIEQHPWNTRPQHELIAEWVQRIDLDHLRAQGYPDLMREDDVLPLIKRGSIKGMHDLENGTNEGSQWIIQTALQCPPERPLWVLVWGSLTTLAQALHDAPAIAPHIRIYYIGSSNTLHDPKARDYVYNFMQTQYPELWWIENGVLPRGSHETFRGVYLGGVQHGEWGNKAFIDKNIRGHGTTHHGLFPEKSGDAFPVATWPQGSLKEGDTPTFLYLLSPAIAGIGDVDDPTAESWGGTFRKAEPARFPNYYVDLDLPPEACQATINRFRLDFMSHWKDRWHRYGA